MSTDNDNTLYKELSTLVKQYVPSNLLIKNIETLGQIKEDVLQLNDALQDLINSSGLTAAQLKNVTEEAFRLGDAAGKSGIEVLSYVTAAKKTGYDIKESLTLAKETLKMSNISPNIDSASEAMGHMKSILDGFQETPDFASNINDALTGISRTRDIDFDTLTEGATKLAQSAGNAGMSFEQMMGLLTSAYDVLGDMEQVTNGELALFSGLKESYKDIDNIYIVLEQLNSVWKTLDNSSKESFAVSTVGEGQKELFSALMNNWDSVEQAVWSASNSIGAADSANTSYLNSLAGKTETLQNKFQNFSSQLVNSGILNFFLDLGNTGVSAINSISDSIGSLGTIGAFMGGYLTSKNLGRANIDSCPSLNMPSLSCFSWIQGFYGRSCAIHG